MELLHEQARTALGSEAGRRLQRRAQGLSLRLLQTGYAASLVPAWSRFLRAAADPERAQKRRLRGLLEANASSAYGRQHRFDRISSVAAFQDRVPIVSYDELAPWMDRIWYGEQGVLTTAPVRMLERSGGSTATNKLIPYTDELLAEFSEATGAWLFNLYRRYPRLFGTRSYWSLSPVTRQAERSPGGLPVGFEADTEYFGALAGWILGRMMAVPRSVARLPDMEAWRFETARHLLSAQDLGLISVWSPSFLTLLMRFIDDRFEELLAALPASRADELRRDVQRAGRLTAEALWPRLALVSCWTEAAAASFVPEVRRWCPATPIQPKGLLATEGVVTFPLWGADGAVAAIGSHFLEFRDLERPEARPLLAHELRVGGQYSPLLTTGGGLYRYELKDLLHCVGHWRKAPLLRFGGKLDCVSDLCGEKITAQQVEAGLALARRELGVDWDFALLAPEWGEPPAYRLFVDSDADEERLRRVATILERHLATGHHYAYCRSLGQLGPIEHRRVQDGWATYQRSLVERGQRAGDIKPTVLDRRMFWGAVLEA